MLKKFNQTYNEYPKSFWVLSLATFVDELGGFMLFPFFSLYITAHFNVGMAQVGIVFAIFAVTNMIGQTVGGSIADKFGRKKALLFGLFFSALSSLGIIFIDTMPVFYVVAALSGLLGSVGGPARQAMVADMLPEEQHNEGYGINRVAFNISAAVGPILGGLLAASAFEYLFIGDVITSTITALIVIRGIPETKPATPEEQEEQSLGQNLAGYQVILKDKLYMAFLASFVVIMGVVLQMNITLPVFMRDAHGFPPIYYGYIYSMNGIFVVLFQLRFSRWASKYPPMLMLALGAFLYMIGFGMFGFIAPFALFVVAMLIITVAEVILFPVAQAVVAKFAPEDMRGRYMAAFGLSWGVPNIFVPYLSGMIMDQYDPNWVWYLSGIFGGVTALIYISLHIRTKNTVKLSVEREAV